MTLPAIHTAEAARKLNAEKAMAFGRLLEDDPDMLDTLLAHIVDGGCLTTACQAWGLRYSDVVRWVFADKGRTESWNSAIKARAEWAMESVLGRVREFAFADIKACYTNDHRLKPMNEWPASALAALQGLEVTESKDGSIKTKAKWADQFGPLKLLGEQLGVFQPESGKGEFSLAELVRAARDAAVESGKVVAVDAEVTGPVRAEETGGSSSPL